MIQEALTQADDGERESPEDPDTSDSEANGTSLVLMPRQDDLLESIFWLALGCVLGWQDKECYEGENPEVLCETVTSPP